MLDNLLFRRFLMLSIILIVLGILFIIFIHFDRGYGPGQKTDYVSEQNNLIAHEYDILVKTVAPSQHPLKKDKETTLEKIKAIITPKQASQDADLQQVTEMQPASAQITPVPDVNETLVTASDRQDYSVWNQSRMEYDYQMMLLRDNPWSPYFQPGQ